MVQCQVALNIILLYFIVVLCKLLPYNDCFLNSLTYEEYLSSKEGSQLFIHSVIPMHKNVFTFKTECGWRHWMDRNFKKGNDEGDSVYKTISQLNLCITARTHQRLSYTIWEDSEEKIGVLRGRRKKTCKRSWQLLLNKLWCFIIRSNGDEAANDDANLNDSGVGNTTIQRQVHTNTNKYHTTGNVRIT